MKYGVVVIGSAPLEEPCARVGSYACLVRSVIECRALGRMLVRSVSDPPPGARLTIQHRPAADEGDPCREICVRFNGESGGRYAVECEAHRPKRWDEWARAEIVWDTARHLFHRLMRVGWLTPPDVPECFLRKEPPQAVEYLMNDPRWLLSTDMLWYSPGIVSRELGTPIIASVLGSLTTPLGRGLIVRRNSGELYLASQNLRGCVTPLSDTAPPGYAAKSPCHFLAKRGSVTDYVLRHSLPVSDWCLRTDEVWPDARDGRHYTVWRIHTRILHNSVPVWLPLEPQPVPRSCA